MTNKSNCHKGSANDDSGSIGREAFVIDTLVDKICTYVNQAPNGKIIGSFAHE